MSGQRQRTLTRSRGGACAAPGLEWISVRIALCGTAVPVRYRRCPHPSHLIPSPPSPSSLSSPSPPLVKRNRRGRCGADAPRRALFPHCYCWWSRHWPPHGAASPRLKYVGFTQRKYATRWGYGWSPPRGGAPAQRHPRCDGGADGEGPLHEQWKSRLAAVASCFVCRLLFRTQGPAVRQLCARTGQSQHGERRVHGETPVSAAAARPPQRA